MEAQRRETFILVVNNHYIIFSEIVKHKPLNQLSLFNDCWLSPLHYLLRPLLDPSLTPSSHPSSKSEADG
jgi:hypothetical protein